MRSSSQVVGPSLPGEGGGSVGAASLLCPTLRQRPTRVRFPWFRRGASDGCLFDPAGSCVLSALLARPDPRPELEDLVAALAAEADARFDAAVRDRGVVDERLSEALIVRRALQQWITDATNRRQRRRARAGVGAALMSSAYSVPLCLLADASLRFTVGVAITIVTAGSAVSALAFLRRMRTGWPLPQLIAGLLCATGVGILLIVEGATGRVVVGDEVATLIGLAVAGVSLLIQAVVTRLASTG